MDLVTTVLMWFFAGLGVGFAFMEFFSGFKAHKLIGARMKGYLGLIWREDGTFEFIVPKKVYTEEGVTYIDFGKYGVLPLKPPTQYVGIPKKNEKGEMEVDKEGKVIVEKIVPAHPYFFIQYRKDRFKVVNLREGNLLPFSPYDIVQGELDMSTIDLLIEKKVQSKISLVEALRPSLLSSDALKKIGLVIIGTLVLIVVLPFILKVIGG